MPTRLPAESSGTNSCTARVKVLNNLKAIFLTSAKGKGGRRKEKENLGKSAAASKPCEKAVAAEVTRRTRKRYQALPELNSFSGGKLLPRHWINQLWEIIHLRLAGDGTKE